MSALGNGGLEAHIFQPAMDVTVSNYSQQDGSSFYSLAHRGWILTLGTWCWWLFI